MLITLPDLPWDYATDMFSVGCIFFEMLSGSPLFFRAKTDAERLATMETAIGLFPLSVVHEVNKVGYGAFYYDTTWRVRFPRNTHDVEYSSVELERAFNRLAKTRDYRVSIYSFCLFCSNYAPMSNTNTPYRHPCSVGPLVVSYGDF